jgi:iron complex outermembrane recepter protein
MRGTPSITRNVLKISTALAALAAGFVPSCAQETGTIETIIVTGTHIQRPNLQANSPITTVDTKDIQMEGVTTIETALNQLPQVVANANEHMSGGSDGTSNVDLRGLGSNRNLVLIDGQRLLPSTAVDVNFIPAALIQRVDVLTGGASAAYGSDAISGVVNFIMDKHLTGIRVTGQYSINEHGNDLTYERGLMDAMGFKKAPSVVVDGAQYDINVAMGADFAGSKGNVTGYLGYRSTDPVKQSARDFSACGMYHDSLTSMVCGGSSNNAYGHSGIMSGPNAGSDWENAKDGSRTWVLNDGTFGYNYGPDNYIQRQDRRITTGVFANYQALPWLNVYANSMFMADMSTSHEAPSAIWFGTEVYNVNCDNPFLSNSQKLIACGSTTSTADSQMMIGYRMAKGAPRANDMRHNDFRFQIGAKGEVNEHISFDLNVVQAMMTANWVYQNDVNNYAPVEHGLEVVSVSGVPTCKSVVDGTDPKCVPIDVFSANGPSAAAYKYMFVNQFTKDTETMTLMSASMNADLGAYGLTSPLAKDGLVTAFGFERRVETNNYKGDIQAHANGINDTDGYTKNDELYIEADFPLIQDKPFVKSLSINAAYRYSFFTAHTSTSAAAQKTFMTYKVAGDYSPNDDVRFRVGYNRAVRAPNVGELFAPQGLGIISMLDPCAGATPTASPAVCQLTRVTAAEYGHVTQCPTTDCNMQGGGNPALKPEIAETITAGMVLTPEALEGLSVSVDYFNIRVAGYISTIDPALISAQCVATSNPYYCSLFHRNHSAGGIIFGNGGWITSTNLNTGHLKTSGLDFAGSYRWDASEWGGFEFSLLGTYLLSKVTQPLPGDPGSFDCSGLNGPNCGEPQPTWRHTLRTTWQIPDSSAELSLNWRFIGGTTLSNWSSNPLLASDHFVLGSHVADYSYFDLSGSVNLNENLLLRLGINNILDKTPPALDAGLLGATSNAWGNGNTWPGVYDPLGRMFFVNVTAKY